MTRKTFVIVGAGLAGATAAKALRDEGFDGRVVAVGAERDRPYHRPPLSKAFLRGEVARDGFHVHDPDFYAAQEIELWLHSRAVQVDVADRAVEVADGRRLRYDALLLATGAAPRRLRVPGAELGGVVHLRELADAEGLRERLRPGAAVVVVGAGWIGAEVASSARRLGADVTVIDPAPVPLGRALGAEVGGLYRDLHTANGVRMLLGTGVEALEGGRTVERVRTSDGREVPCDLVVVGIGVQPRTSLAERAGLPVADGIVVDDQLRTSVSSVMAAGDVARPWHPFYGEALRVEHWATARDHGVVAARAMLGRGAVSDRLPRFGSEQHGVSMSYTGFARSWDRVVFRGEPAEHRYVAFWIAGDRVLAGMSVGVAHAGAAIERLIRERVPVDDRLADEEVPLEALTGVPA